MNSRQVTNKRVSMLHPQDKPSAPAFKKREEEMVKLRNKKRQSKQTEKRNERQVASIADHYIKQFDDDSKPIISAFEGVNPGPPPPQKLVAFFKTLRDPHTNLETKVQMVVEMQKNLDVLTFEDQMNFKIPKDLDILEQLQELILEAPSEKMKCLLIDMLIWFELNEVDDLLDDDIMDDEEEFERKNQKIAKQNIQFSNNLLIEAMDLEGKFTIETRLKLFETLKYKLEREPEVKIIMLNERFQFFLNIFESPSQDEKIRMEALSCIFKLVQDQFEEYENMAKVYDFLLRLMEESNLLEVKFTRELLETIEDIIKYSKEEEPLYRFLGHKSPCFLPQKLLQFMSDILDRIDSFITH